MAIHRMKDIDWESPVIPVPSTIEPALGDEVNQVLGTRKPPLAFHMTGLNPWLVRTQLDILRRPFAVAPARLLKLAELVTSQESACRYCWGAARTSLRFLGLTESDIDEIEQEAKLADETEQELLGFCRDLARSNPRPARQELLKMQRLGFSEATCLELAFAVAGTCYLNRVNTLLATPPVADFERLPDTFLGKLLRPLIKRHLTRRPPPPPYPYPEPGTPFAEVAMLLGKTPAAAVLHHALQGAFASRVLPVRTKCLMFAVVARYLSCPVCESEARRSLSLVDFPSDQIDEVLHTLTSPTLDERERQLVPWVRESVRIDQPGPLQRQTRQLVDELGSEIMIEAIGVAALANTTVRVAMLAE